MNILVLANKVPCPPRDGGALATYNMIVGLTQAGVRITLLAISTSKHPGSKQSCSQAFAESVDVEVVHVDTSICWGKALWNLLFSDRPYNAVRFDSPSFHKVIEGTLKRNTFDLVQLEGAYLQPYIKTIRRFFAGPIALRAHNVEWEIWRRIADNQGCCLKRWYANRLAGRIMHLEKDILREVDVLIPISHRDNHKLRQMGFAGETYVSPAGFELDFDEGDDLDVEFPSIFHIGGLDWLPNHEGLLWFLENCWDDILSMVPNARFYIAGRNASKAFADQLNAFPSVVFCGEVESSVRFIRSKGIMVVPLLSGSGMRVKIVEGMALGKAIVSTSIGAEGIGAEPGDSIAIADSPHDFTREVVTLLLHRENSLAMGRHASAYARKHFDNSILTRSLYGFYAAYLSKKGSTTAPL